MKEIEGEWLNGPELRTVWVGDLVEFEGPILVLLADVGQTGKYYLSKWVDIVDGYNRWAVVPFGGELMDEFFAGRCSLRDVYCSPHDVYLYDYHRELSPARVLKIRQDQLPADYLPETDSHYSESAYTQFAADFRLGRQRAGPPKTGASD